MSVETIFDSPSGTIWYHPDKKILHHKIHKYMYDKVFMDFLMLGTQTMKEKGAHKWLSDDQTNMAISKEFIAWGLAEWFPKTIAAGWQYWAIVRPKNLIGQLDLEKLAKEYGSMGITAKFFDNSDEAMDWLEKQ
jgi:hypothetical protein